MQDRYEYNSVDVAKYIAAYANEHKFSINVTKIQKLLYIAYGLYLSVRGKRLTDERPKAWLYGPVFPSTREMLIKTKISDIRINDPDLSDLKKDEDLTGLIDLVFKKFGIRTASDLTNWSHKKNSAWDKTTLLKNFKWGREIPDHFIKEYFDQKIVKSGKQTA